MNLSYFTDDNNVHFIHDADMDITGYGKSINEAKELFLIILTDVVEPNGIKKYRNEVAQYLENYDKKRKGYRHLT